MMKAAVIDSLERGPRFADFAEPVVTGGETLIEVTAAGLHPIVRMLASGEHPGSQGTLPMIPGIDGAGRAPDGTRVYFGGVRAPSGPMAQRAAAGFVVPLPDGLDEVTAAAITRRGMTHTVPRVRLVEVGRMAGPVISLSADVLRSSGLEILGSTLPLGKVTGVIPGFMAIAAAGGLPIEIDEVPLGDVGPATAIVERLRAEGRLHPSWAHDEAAVLLRELTSFRVWDDLVNDAKIPSDQYVELITAVTLSTLGAPVTRSASPENAEGVSPAS
jgi:hypothetical protein